MIIRYLFAVCLLCFASTAQAVSLSSNIGDERQSYAANPGNTETDPSWQPYSPFLKTDGAHFWYSHKISVYHEPGETVSNPLTLSVRLNGVFDFYWDGALIGSNKYLGKSASQYSRVHIPVSGLSEGEHQLKIHIVALGMRAGDSSDLRVAVAAVKSDFFGVHPTVVSTFFIATASLFLAGYLTVTLRTGRQRPGNVATIFFSIAIAMVVLLEDGRFLFKYPYGWQSFLDMLQPPFAVMFFILLTWLVLTRISYPNRLAWMVVLPVSLAISLIETGGIEHHIRLFFTLSLFLLALSSYGWYRGYGNARLFAIGFALAIVALLLDLDKGHLFLIVITVLFATDLAIDMRQQGKNAIRHLLMSERLRSDLIKRNVQPHFLMNSLTALMEWVETSPDEAVNFIDGLAQEFRILDEFSERRSVSLKQELALCNIHLTLMGQRLASCFRLEASSVDTDQQVPPALFHTLIENAFSHNDYRAFEATFVLTQETTASGRILRLSVPVKNPHSSSHSAGLGTRYIEARLEEFCGKAFSFQSEMIGSTWVSTITLNRH